MGRVGALFRRDNSKGMNYFWIFPDVWTRFTEVLLIYGRHAVAGFDYCPFVWMKADVMLGRYFLNISCDYMLLAFAH